MRTLDEIALSTGTDKASTGHNYTAVYDSILSPLRDKEIALLEIGVWEGASLAMWREYFSLGLVAGLDIDTTRANGDLIRGTHIRQGDATDERFINDAVAAYGPFDVIIDDGAHISEISQAEFRLLWRAVTPGGWYFIEDVHTYFWPHANPRGSDGWLFDLARDAMGRGADRAGGDVKQSSVALVSFYESLVAIQKS